MATGFLTVASGYGSVAAGLFTTAQSRTEVAIGQCNDVSATPCSEDWCASDAIFRVGNGSSQGFGCGSRNDAFKVMKDGTVYVADVELTAHLHEMKALKEEVANLKSIVMQLSTSLAELAPSLKTVAAKPV